MAIAAMQPRISTLKFSAFVVKMDELIIKTFAKTNFKIEPEIHNATIDELCYDLQKYNGTLTFEEIELAFKNGYKKVYGDFFGLSNATYFGWVNAYTWHFNRLNAKKAIEIANKPQPKPEISEEEKQKQVLGGVLRTFEDFKKGANILDPGNCSYNFLDKKGLIKFTKERKNKFIAVAKEKLIQDALTKKGIKSISKVIQSVTSEKSVIISNAKREALKTYFSDLIEMKQELKDELIGKLNN